MKKILLFVTIFLINLNLGEVENKKHTDILRDRNEERKIER